MISYVTIMPQWFVYLNNFVWIVLVITEYVCVFVSLLLSIPVNQYLQSYKNEKFDYKFYFNNEEGKYCIHYAESKERVICSTEKNLENASKVKYFKIEDIKNKYEIICENDMEPEEADS